MRKGVLLVSVLGAVVALAYLVEAWRYPLGTMAQPGAGVFPLVVGALLLVSTIGMGLQARGQLSVTLIDWPRGADFWRLAAVVVGSAGYVWLLPLVGHMVAGTLVSLVVLQVMGIASWPAKLLGAVVLGAGSYLLFAVVLGVPLPSGTLFG